MNFSFATKAKVCQPKDLDPLQCFLVNGETAQVIGRVQLTGGMHISGFTRW